MADEELAIPQVPAAKQNDPEDVSWALSTAEAMWARGEHSDGIKWVRKAAEAASDADDDMRALELAKAASDLAAMIARVSSKAIVTDSAPAPPVQKTNQTDKPPLVAPPVLPMKRPSLMPPPVPPSSSSAVGSSPPGGSAPPAPRSSAPRPLATNMQAQGPAVGKGILSNRPAERKKPKADENLEAEAETAAAATPVAAPAAPSRPAPPPVPSSRRAVDNEPTVVAHVQDIIAAQAVETPASEPREPSDPELSADGDRKTTIAAIPAVKPVAAPPVSLQHDPAIRTSQAVRVVVWRDSDGVHVAPAGTVVSAITIDAVLVALEPSADLTAWLSQRGR